MSFSFHFSLKTGQQQRVSSFQTSSLLTFIFQPPEQTLCLCLCPVSEELLSWLLSPDPCGRLTAEISHQHWWFDPLEERADVKEVTVVLPLGVTKDPEAQEYLVGLGLLPDAGALEPSGPGGSSRMSLPLVQWSL